MDVLIVDDCAVDGPLVAKLVERMGHRATLARTPHEAGPLVEASAPHLIITDLLMPGLSGADFVKSVRSREAPHYVYVIMRTSRDTDATATGAFDAGVDDFIAKSRSVDELRARIRAAERIISLETRLRTRVLDLESALRRLDISAAALAVAAENAAVAPRPPPSATEPASGRVSEADAWRALPATLATSIAQFTQQPFAALADTSSPVEHDADGVDVAITLTDATRGVELALALHATKATLRHLARELLDAADDEALVDLLSETANVAMGCMKSAFGREGFALTAGVPLRAGAFDPLLPMHPERRQLVATAGDLRIDMLVGARRAKPQQVTVPLLREGMVTATDVMGPSGMLLIRAGTRLTETLCERLQRQLARTAVVELVDPSV